MISTYQGDLNYPSWGLHSVECRSLQDLSSFMTSSVWSHIVWVGGTRSEELFAFSQFFVLDYDEGLTKKEVIQILNDKGLAYAIGPTKSDGLEKVSASGKSKVACDRFRVALKINAPIYDSDVYIYNAQKWIAEFKADPQTFDAARLWQPCKSIEGVKEDGKALEVVTQIPFENTRQFKNEQIINNLRWRKDQGNLLPRRVNDFLRGRFLPSEFNSELYYSTLTLLQFGYDLEKIRTFYQKIPGCTSHDKYESTLKSAAKKALKTM